MRLLRRLTVGIIGRIFAILLLALLVEFGATTFLYERASHFSVRDDEANRLAEHLVISRRLVAEQPVQRRGAMAEELTTTRYLVRWQPSRPEPPRVAPRLDEMQVQILDWEPSLAAHGLWLRLTSPGRNGFIAGGVALDDGSWLYFRTLEPLRALDLAIGRLLLSLTPAIALIVIGGVMVSHVLRPMRRLARVADRVGHGAVETVPETGPGEVRRVIAAFNAMQDRIHRLIADRTEALAAVGHDFRTPLARLRLRADSVDDDEVRDAIQRDVAEMDDMVASLLAYLGGDGDSETPARTDLAVMCETIASDAADNGRDAIYSGPDHCEMVVRVSGLKRAIVNLVENALHYGGNARLILEPRDAAVAIRVEDDGPGIPDDDAQAVLQPFVRLDNARTRDTSGFGLGLPIVARAVDAEGGTLTLANRADGGLSAEIVLPRP
ncbi:ATP-binding protein [Sphingomonas donggukensis]|uniref:histidine kinase n=1 Tax=Sphingomonas donggukensis TaxID=2949093 RepID=A0ABY4TWG6_9SPHN|nr:ATP-binding protein [Sphingomonas donggukensis]URW74668.1 ATP-binding protein [Sphingomonas donggukensis]